MTDAVLVAVIVAFFLGAAWLVTVLGRLTGGYRDDVGPEDEERGQSAQLTEAEQPR